MTVSIGTVRSARGAASYFAGDNYYTAHQAEMTSAWAGQGARAAGLAGTVAAVTFEQVLDGKLPNGRQVGDADKRVRGRDFTFSMPKSASLLAYVSGDQRILAAHMQAVRETMAWAERHLAEARIKVAGRDVPIRTGNLVYALFAHDTSRKADPQGHIHAVIANMTQLPKEFRQPDKVDPRTGEILRDDGWRAWHNPAFYKGNPAITAIYHAIFREKITMLGYSVQLDVGAKHGEFEVLGPNGERIAPAAIAGFSKRSADIRGKAELLGITSPEGRREVTQRTRDAKADPGDRDVLASRWRAEAEDYGYNGDQLYHAALARSHVRPSLLERGRSAVAAAIADTSLRLSDFLRSPSDPLVDRGLAALTRSPGQALAQYATASAIRILAEREAAFATLDIVRTALNLGERGVTPDRVEQRIGELIAAGELIQEKSTRLDHAVDIVTTRDAIAQEQRILAAMEAGRAMGRALMPADVAAQRLQELAGPRPLNGQQLAAAVQIVASHDRVVLVQGRAGSGKSTMLQPVAKAEALDAAMRLLGQSGKRAVLLTAAAKGEATALAFQNKMVADLRQDTGLEAMTVHAFIASNARFLDGTAGPEALSERKAALAGRYLVLDEASMISSGQMDRLIAIANLMEVGRLAVIGDRKQLNPIDAGKAFAVMLAGSVEDSSGYSQVHINMRQKNETMRAIADLADAGAVRAALEIMADRVIESDDRVGAAAAAWLALAPAERLVTTLLPSSRDGRSRANALIQNGLKAEGALLGEGREFHIRESLNLTREELRYARNWAAARYLEVGSRTNPLGLAPGDYRIERVQANDRVVLRDMQGRSHRVDPRRINVAGRDDRLRLANEKAIQVHRHERIRWTDSDKRPGRGMLNATIATVEHVSAEGIVVRLVSGEVRTLQNGDRMLQRMDLAYAINTHMAQGITNETVFSVMGARETNLSNARAFLVNHTRQQFDVRLFTDNKEQLIRQLEANRGDKSSALETIGALAVEQLLREDQRQQPSGHTSIASDLSAGTSRPTQGSAKLEDAPASRQDAERIASAAAQRYSADLGLGRHAPPPQSRLEPAQTRGAQPQLDRSKGLEL